jgi:hypothetical protein
MAKTNSVSNSQLKKQQNDDLSGVQSKRTQASQIDNNKTRDSKKKEEQAKSQQNFRTKVISPRSYLRSAQKSGLDKNAGGS